MNTNKVTFQIVNTRIVLAGLWIAHFLLWSFGDMLALLQNFSEPVENTLLLFVATPLAIIQVSMMFLSLVGKMQVMRWANIVFAVVFFVFNVGFIAEAHVGWEYLLGLAYVAANVLVIRYAWKWSTKDA